MSDETPKRMIDDPGASPALRALLRRVGAAQRPLPEAESEAIHERVHATLDEREGDGQSGEHHRRVGSG